MPTHFLRHLFAVLTVVGSAAPERSHAQIAAPTIAPASKCAADIDVASVLNSLGDPDADVRLAAGKKLLEHAHALAAHADTIAEAVALLDPLDDESDVRRFGRRALLRIGNPALPAVIAHLPEDDELLAALAEPGDTASIEPLIRLIAANKALSRDGDGWSNQTGVKQALLLIGSDKVAAPLIKALREDRDSLPLLVAVSQMAGPDFGEAAPLLAEYLADEDEGRCKLAANGLFHIGDAACAELAAALKDRKRRAAAIYAVLQLGPQAASLSERLVELAKDENPFANDLVLTEFGRPAETTVAEMARLALSQSRPPADRLLELDGFDKAAARLNNGTFLGDPSPFTFRSSDFGAGGKRLADLIDHALSREVTAKRVETRCREAVARVAGDLEAEQYVRRQAIVNERFYRVLLAAVWSRAEGNDPRLPAAVIQLCEEADHRAFPEYDYSDTGCASLEWPEWGYLREPIQRRPDAYLPRLREMLRGDDADRTKALYLYAHLGPHGRDAIDTAHSTIKSESRDARKAALLVLDTHATPSKQFAAAMIDRVLCEAFGQPHDIWILCYRALVKNRQFIPNHVPQLVKELSRGQAAGISATERIRARRAANIMALVGPVGAPAVPLLVEMTKSGEAADREAAIAALGGIAKAPDAALPALAEAYQAARERKLEAIELYFASKAFETCELALVVNAIGQFRAAAKSQIGLLAEAALRKPDIEVDPKTGKRQSPDRYEEQVAVEAAIALGRIGPAAGDALPRLREALFHRDDFPEYRPRHLALAIAAARIGEEQASDLATVGELLRTIPVWDIERDIAEELAELGKRHAAIGRLFARHFVRLSRSQDISGDSPNWYSIDGEIPEMTFLAPYVQVARPSDEDCCRALENMLVARLSRWEQTHWEFKFLMEAIRVFDDSSDRLTAILKSAAKHEDPETRWQAAAMLERIAADPPPSPRVKSTHTSATP